MNTEKSAVARPEDRHFLGFSLRRKPDDGEVEIGLSKRSKERIDSRIRAITPRNWGSLLKACISRVNEYVTGRVGLFGICTAQVEGTLGSLVAHRRRRLCAIQLTQWKCKRTIAQKPIRHGIRLKSAWRSVYDGRKAIWKMRHMPTVDRAIPNSLWDERGLVPLLQRYRAHPGASLPRCSSRWHWERRGRNPANCRGNNQQSRRAAHEQHNYGSLRGALGNGGPYLAGHGLSISEGAPKPQCVRSAPPRRFS